MKTGTPLRALVLVFGCYAFPASPVWSHGENDHHSDGIEQIIEPDDIYELCLLLSPQQSLRYAFSATHRLGFNIHYHENDVAIYPVVDHQTSAAEAIFTAESEQEYCLMWTNHGSAKVLLSLRYETGRR